MNGNIFQKENLTKGETNETFGPEIFNSFRTIQYCKKNIPDFEKDLKNLNNKEIIELIFDDNDYGFDAYLHIAIVHDSYIIRKTAIEKALNYRVSPDQYTEFFRFSNDDNIKKLLLNFLQTNNLLTYDIQKWYIMTSSNNDGLNYYIENSKNFVSDTIANFVLYAHNPMISLFAFESIIEKCKNINDLLFIAKKTNHQIIADKIFEKIINSDISSSGTENGVINLLTNELVGINSDKYPLNCKLEATIHNLKTTNPSKLLLGISLGKLAIICYGKFDEIHDKIIKYLQFL